ncbi:DMT family transporter [Vibrio clamense]|uniref:DMT family transporter n=1 Tax=Vibrio TaxID=662 RepID=UPI000DE9EFC5|nr:DMT family transporter [Vibrio cortegadensis]MDN3695878.1 DMT family transporter [Vibrio cortegadensis]RBW63773.1 EamA/RhaT family transporter [Vibrionales bacterium C3R12]
MNYGYPAIIATLLLWSGFFLSLKGGANSNLTPADIAMMRFALPALVLLPLVVKARIEIMKVPLRYLIGMFIGCGLPYLLIASTAMHFVPVAHGSALVPGTLPLFVSAIAVILFKQPLSQHRKLGLAFVFLGILLFLTSSLAEYDGNQLTGHLLFLMGSMMWAMFTICARVANLDALVSAGLISLLSVIALFALVSTGTLDSHLTSIPFNSWPWQELAGHLMLQGLGAGLLAAFTYLYAINKLGAERSAAFGSATPAVATLLAIPIFDEVPDLTTWAALGFICVGSIIASNVFLKNDASLQYRPPTRDQ